MKLSVDLGLSMYPKNPQMEDWFRRSSEILNIIGKKREEEERKISEELREKIKKENEKIFKELDIHFRNDSTEKFIEYIIENYPANSDIVRNLNVKEEAKKVGMKKILLKLIPYYHPDKVFRL